MNYLNSQPSASEHAAWAITYMNATSAALKAANTSSVMVLLEGQVAALNALFPGGSSNKADYAYAPGKWTLAESLLHVADTERVFTYRAVRFARGDKTALPGFEQDDWVPESRASVRQFSDILTEIATVRAAALSLVRSLDETAAQQIGIASGAPLSVRALVWMMAGHFAHHLEITQSRYLNAA